jgi:hypothetical protein
MTLLCPAHNLPARFRASSLHIYQGRDYGPVWECPRPECDAYVGCHPDGAPKGTLAGKALRQLRMQAHDRFDRLWKPWEAQQLAYPEEKRVIGKLRRVMRVRAYEWLAAMMGKAFDDTHIAMFDEAAVRRAIAILDEHKPTSASIRDWAKARKEAA